MLAELVEKYAWADDYSMDGIESWTVAVIERRAPDEVVSAYGGDPASPAGSYTFNEAFGLQGEPHAESEYGFGSGINFHVQVKPVGQYVVALENNGYTGNVPEIARRCSADGRQFFAVHWASNVNPEICQGINGRVVGHFETFAGETAYSGEPAPSWIIGQRIHIEHLRATALAFMEQQTGVAFDRVWLDEKLPTYRIPDPDVLLRDVPDARVP